MAERRMICKKIVDTDTFTDMPITTRLLYYELNWRADDDGFISSPKKIIRAAGCSDDDLKILIAKQFVIPFESGIILIKDWKLHNYIAKDRYHPTIYADEKDQIITTNSGSYTKRIQDVYNPMTQVRLGKVSQGKDSQDESESVLPETKHKHKYGEYKNVLLTDEELQKLKDKFVDYDDKIQNFSEGLELKGYVYKSHYLAILKWSGNGTGSPAGPKKLSGGGYE